MYFFLIPKFSLEKLLVVMKELIMNINKTLIIYSSKSGVSSENLPFIT